MDCPTCEAMVDAYVDGELSLTERTAFERALDSCPDCRRRLETVRAMSGMLRALPAVPAPDLLRARVERDVRDIGERPVAWPRWMAMAASLLLAVGIGWLGGAHFGQGGREEGEMIATYLRVTGGERPVEVASSDRHTVKPWFAGRIDYAPPVHDLTAAGFPLEGGRIDVVSGRKVSVLVYRRNQHRVALTLVPATGAADAPVRVERRDGFTLARWRHGGFEMSAVSDLMPGEMTSFAGAIDRAIAADR